MTDMNWRDLLAGMALIGMLSSGDRGRDLSREAYQYADDLLEARDLDNLGIVSVKKRKNRVPKQEVA